MSAFLQGLKERWLVLIGRGCSCQACSEADELFVPFRLCSWCSTEEHHFERDGRAHTKRTCADRERDACAHLVVPGWRR